MRVPPKGDSIRALLEAAGYRLFADRVLWINASARKVVVQNYADTCGLERLRTFIEKQNTSGTWEVLAETDMERAAVRAAIVKAMS